MKNIQVHFSQKTLRIMFSFISAILLWSFVMDQENPLVEKTFKNITIEHKNEDSLKSKNLVFTDESKNTVDVTVAGRKDHIIYLKPEDIDVFVDLSSAAYGKKNFLLNAMLKDSDARIQNLSQKEITIKFDTLVSKNFIIETQEMGKLPDDCTLDSVDSDKKNVTYSGAKRFVDSISRVVSNFDRSKVNENYQISSITPLDSNNKEVKDVTPSVKEQKYTYKVTKKIELPVTYTTFNDIPSGLKLISIETTPKYVTIEGDSKKVDELQKKIQNKISFDVDLSSIKRNYSQEYNIEDIDSSLKLSEIPKIIIEVEKIELKEFKITKSNLNFENLRNDLEVENVVFDSPKFYAFATSSDLEKLQQNPITFNVDMQSINEEGEARVYATLDTKKIEDIKFSLKKTDKPTKSLEIQLVLTIKKIKGN